MNNVQTTSAQNTGMCVISQGSTTQNFTLPFYINKVEYNYAFMSNKNTYTDTVSSVETEQSCANISLKSNDKSKDKNGGSYINTVYYISQTNRALTAQEKYDLGKNQFATVNNFSAFYNNGETQYASVISGKYIIIDETPPQIIKDGWTGSYITNINSPSSIDEIKNLMKAEDETDGTVEIYVITDEYTENKKTVGGPYIVTFGAKDSSNNEAQIDMQIYIVDTTSPTISGTSTYTSNMSNHISVSAIKQALVVTDNYDQNLSITQLNDTWSSNKNNEGTFFITYQAIDSSNNKSEIFTVSITNYDDIAPLISGENTYNVSNTSQITQEYILSVLKITDNIEQTIIPSITIDNYSPNKNTVGSYTMTIKAKDKNNNESLDFIVTINVFDNTAPVFYVSGKFIAVSPDTKLSIDQLTRIIAQSNNIEYNDVTTTTLNYDNYTSNYNTSGTYTISLTYTLTDNSLKDIIQDIKVIDIENIEFPSTSTSKNNNSTKNKLNWFQRLWNTIIKLFLNIWNAIKYFFSFKWL